MKNMVAPHANSPRHYIELVLDVLEGCKFECSGCRVSKKAHPLPSDDALLLLETFIDDAAANGVVLREVQFGPTDVITSNNADEVRDSPTIRRIAQTALAVSFNCPFLDPNPEQYDWLVDFLEDMVPHGHVKFIVPLELRHRNNIVYIERIRKNIAYVRSRLHTVVVYKVYANYRFDMTPSEIETTSPESLSVLLQDAYRTKLHENTNVDFITPHGREGFSEAERVNFLAMNQHLNAAMCLIHEANNGGPVINDLNPSDGLDWTLVYSRNQLFFAPFLNEPRVTYLPEYRIAKAWTYDRVLQQRESWVVEGLQSLDRRPSCSECPNMAMCAERGVFKLMDTLDTTDCLTAVGPLVNPRLDTAYV